MGRRTDLENSARSFAGQLRTLLRTVCYGYGAVNAIPTSESQCAVGTRIGQGRLRPSPVPLRTASAGAKCWLTIACRLEDVLECLIDEGIVLPLKGWREVLNDSRDQLRERQLRAMIARKPDVAAEALAECGYKVTRTEPAAAKVIQFLPRPRSGKER